jgi:hypothetical protein
MRLLLASLGHMNALGVSVVTLGVKNVVAETLVHPSTETKNPS